MVIDLLLITSGLVAAVHLVCTAALLPQGSPWSVEVEIAGGFSSAIGVVITALHSDQPRSLMFGGALILFVVLFSIEKSIRNKTCIIVLEDKEG